MDGAAQPPLDPTASDYKDQFKQRLSAEAINIENQEIRDLADRTLKTLFFDSKGNFKPVRFVDHVLKSFPEGTFITPMNDQGGDVVWRYDENKGIFVNNGVPFIEQALKSILGEDTTTAQYSHVIKHLQVSTYTEPRDFEENPNIIVLKNGCYNLITQELEPFNPLYYARAAMPVIYDPKADCPTIKKFLGEIIPNSVAFYQEWMGYHLLKDYRFQRCVVHVGDGDNGKSTLLSLQTAFLGRENCASQSLFRLTTQRFAAAELNDKLGNITADIGPDELKHTGTIKMLTGGDTITAEKKNRDPFQFVNHAKLTFSCNQLPRTPDETLAFFKRFIVIVYDKVIPKEEQDPQLLEKLTTDEELSGLFNWAVQGLKRALERGRLDEPGDALERKELYLAMSDPVTGFYNEYIEEEKENFEIKQDVFTAFHQYCKNKGFVPISDRKFIEQFKKTAWVREYKPKLWTDEYPKGAQINCWRGIKLSDACKKTLYWSTKKAYDAVHGSQKNLENIQDIQDIQGPQTRPEGIDSENGVEDAGYTGYAGYDAELISKAESVLKLNSGRMKQAAFWVHLEKVGYEREKIEFKLRSNPRFSFIGMDVKLVEAP